MEIIKFPECNTIYAEHQDQYTPLPAHKTNDEYKIATSCWKLSIAELCKVILTRRIYAKLMTFGSPLQPIKLTVSKEIE